MDFVHFASCHHLEKSIGGKRLYAEAVEQAIHAESCGYRAVGIPEHHLLNILLVPSPLQLAVKIAAHTKSILLATSICQLPIRDMRVFAGEVVQAQALCDGRLVLGVGKGAFGYETARIGVPMDLTKPKFEESLAVLEALLNGEEVGWSGTYYNFDPVTIMPRPQDPIPIALAIMAPPGIEAGARRGYHIQTTPLGAGHDILLQQVNAFLRGKAEAPAGTSPRLSLQRGVYLASGKADADDKVRRAHEYYKSFDNVFGGPGIVGQGMIKVLPRKQTVEELGQNILICGKNEMIDRLCAYAEIGIDEVILSSNFGQEQQETLDMMSRLAEEVMPTVKAAGPKKH